MADGEVREGAMTVECVCHNVLVVDAVQNSRHQRELKIVLTIQLDFQRSEVPELLVSRK